MIALLPSRARCDRSSPGALFRCGPDRVALTFDDGPHPQRTARLLELLGRARVRATFFVIGERARRHPDLVRRAAGEGHLIENHTWSHAWLPGRPLGGIGDQIDRCQELIERLTGRAPALVRPPYGHRDARLHRAAADRGLLLAMWSLDSLDWLGLGPRLVARRLLRARPGDILLAHDGAPAARGTATGVARLLSHASDTGLRLAPLAAEPGATR